MASTGRMIAQFSLGLQDAARGIRQVAFDQRLADGDALRARDHHIDPGAHFSDDA